MINWTDKELKAAGIDKRKLKALIRCLERAGAYLEELDITARAMSGSLQLEHMSHRFFDDNEGGESHQENVVADVDGGNWDGGDW